MDKQFESFLKNNYALHGPGWCSQRLGVTYRSCVDSASRLELNRRTAKRLAIENYITENYHRLSAKECAISLGISAQRVRSVACSLRISGRQGKTRYSDSVRAEFFDTWSLNMAYVLGFIYADGGMKGDKISFYQNEKYLLMVIRHLMGINNDIRPHGKRCNVLSVNNVYMASRLRDIGIRERKSFGNMICPFGIPDNMFHAFFRGFFDGDGSVGIYGPSKSCRVSLYAEEGFLRWMFDTTSRIVGLTGGCVFHIKDTKMSNFYKCCWAKKEDVRKLFEWMYQDCGNLFLIRKRDILVKANPV